VYRQFPATELGLKRAILTLSWHHRKEQKLVAGTLAAA
jgi:hypothetical protein